MIIFKDISGHTHPAVGTIERKHSLNGEKSLTGTLYRGDEVLNSIDKGWGLEFDGEPYVVTYFERNDNDNSIEFDAVHHFFWRMIKLGFYEEWNGSHSLSVYLDAIFKDSGYKYADNTSAKAFEKENWGMANRLSLFNDVIKSIGAEFEINGNMVSIFPKIGTDLSTIVRHGFNLSDMTIENNSGSFATYGEGFGAYANQQELAGPRLHVTYKSPLYEIYGRLDAEVIDDQRYKVKDNLLNAVKKSVDNSFVVSIKLSLYDLQKAGYPYKMASVGDWLTVIDEKLNFQKRVRIIDIQDSFDANDERTGYTVTCGDLNVIDSYDYGVASIGQRVNDAVKQSQEASSAAILAQISADGKNTIYRLNDINELPTNANEGDLSFVTSGSGTAIYVYTKKEDGSFYWEKRVDPDIGEQIDFSVDQVLSESKEYTNGVKSELSKDIADTTAQAQLMADIAESNAKSEAQAAVKQTNDALVKAKNDLSSNLSKEINDRTNAVNAVSIRTDNVIKQAKEDLNSSISQETINRTKDIADANAKAQSFADKAKSDAISAATTADGKINKRIDDTADSINSTISQNKLDADGKISTVSSTANQALNELSTKVSQTDYDKKTGDLSTKINQTSDTATQSKQDIVDIKTANGTQDSKIASISSDVSGLNAKYTQVNSKVDGLSVGGRNLYIVNKSIPGYVNGANGTISDASSANQEVASDYISVLPNTTYIFQAWGNILKGQQYWAGIGQYDSNKEFINRNPGVYNATVATADTKDYKKAIFTTSSNAGYIRVSSRTFGNYQIKVEQGTLTTDWTPAPEDTDTKMATISAGLAGLSGQFTDYKTSNNGTITTMQGNINANTSAINTKVSLDTFNQKTGEINSRFSQVENDTKAVTTTVGNVQGNLGATNLFTNSEFDKTSGYTTSGNVTLNGLDHKDLVDGNYNGTVSVIATSAGYQGYWGKHIPVIGGGKYAMSVLAHYVPNGVANGYAGLDIWFYDKDKKRISAGGGTGKRWTNSTSPWWNKLTAENVVAPDNAVTVQVSLLVNNAGAGQKADFSQPMVTATEKLQPYTPSPVDFTSDIAQVKVAAEFISNWVKDGNGNLSSTFQNALSRISIVSGSELGNSIVRQTQTQITQAVVANNGQVLNIINQVAGKTLIGAENKIILDAPTVTVSGKAWMDGAVIKNASIGTAQIGTIDASAANIVNINANNITGNATQFVKTQWNNAYGGNVSIDGGRMRVSYGTTQIEYNSGGMVVEYEGDNVGSIGTSISNGVKGLSFFINDQTHHFMSWAQRSRGDKDYSPMMTWAGYNVAQTMNTNKDGGFRIWDNIDFDTYDQTTSVTRWNSNTKVRFMTTDVRFIGQFKTGGERYFKTTGKDINSATQGKRYAYGFSNGGESAGIYFDQGNIWFECYGETHSLSEIFYKINKVS